MSKTIIVGFIVAVFAGTLASQETQNSKPAAGAAAAAPKEEKMQVPEITRLKFQVILTERDSRDKKMREVQNLVMADLDKQQSDLAQKTCEEQGFIVATCKFTISDPLGNPLPLDSWEMHGVKKEAPTKTPQPNPTAAVPKGSK